jgi:hypothetical protein
MQQGEQTETRPRKSPRLKEKGSSGKSVANLAQNLIAQKCGILEEDERLENLTLRQYLVMYRKPLDDQAIEAILKLTEVVVEKKKNTEKNKKDKNKKEKKSEKKSKLGKEQVIDKKQRELERGSLTAPLSQA